MKRWPIAIALLCAFSAQGADDTKDLSLNSRVIVTSECPLARARPTIQTEALGAALLAAIAPSLVSTSVDFVAKAIEAQAQSKTKTFVARGDGYLYQIQKDGKITPSEAAGCLIAVIDDAEPDNAAADWGFHSEQGTADKELRDGVRGMADPVKKKRLPYLYLEALLQPSLDRRYFRIEPKIVYFKKPLISGWGDEMRQVLLIFSFAKPGVQPFASLQFPLNRIEADTYLQATHLGVGTEWAPVLAPDEDEKKISADRAAIYTKVVALEKEVAAKSKELELIKAKRKADYKEPDTEQKENVDKFCKAMADLKAEHDQCQYPRYEALERAGFYTGRMDARKQQVTVEGALAELMTRRAAALDARDKADGKAVENVGLVNIQVAVSETKEPSKFFEFLAASFKGAQGDITTALKNDLIKSNRLAAQKTEFDKDIAAKNERDNTRITFLEAQIAVREKEEALAALGSSPAASALHKAEDELRIAKIKANQAARNAGEQTLPYPEVASL